MLEGVSGTELVSVVCKRKRLWKKELIATGS